MIIDSGVLSRSILDKAKEDMNIMRMDGKIIHSDGIREVKDTEPQACSPDK